MTIGQANGRWSLLLLAEEALVFVLVAAIGVTGADWAIWKLRGGPIGAVTVTRTVVAPLKGNREEYYPDGTETLPCSRSVLPWGGAGACWRMERQRTILER